MGGSQVREPVKAERNGSTARGVEDRCVHELVAEQAARTPDAVAVDANDGRLTYLDLDQRSTALAARLRVAGVGPEVIVAVWLERSTDAAVAFLGILKAGGAYLPLDTNCPPDRLAFILEDARARIVVTTKALAIHLDRRSLEVVEIHGDCRDHPGSAAPTVDRPAGVMPDNLAYVIYTSGSTGRPKGVMIAHRSLTNLVRWHTQTYNLSASDRTTQLAPLGFDASVWEFWPTLAVGATLVIGRAQAAVSSESLARFYQTHRITVSFLVTPLVNHLIGAGAEALSGFGLRLLLTGGDRLSAAPAAMLPFAFANHYGPTEATVVATAKVLDGDTSIGCAISGAQAYVLDEQLNEVQAGERGELFIGGAGVARGYLHRPDLSAERFVPNPFGSPGSRLYRTGDIVRRREDWNLDFIGRLDDQVKIRGYRVEPAEIAALLLEHPAVAQAIVVGREDEPESRRLVAYVVLREGAATSGRELQHHVQAQLPDYMTPATTVFLDALPLTTNGKVDRNALPVPQPARPELDGTFLAPRSPSEQTIAQIWSDVLKVEPVGVQDNFFELGGDSLSAARVVARVEVVLGRKLPVSAIARAGTVERLAALLERS